jgi:hypothetical protein
MIKLPGKAPRKLSPPAMLLPVFPPKQPFPSNLLVFYRRRVL